MTIHMKAPSGTGQVSLCGEAQLGDRISSEWDEVDCAQCAALGFGCMTKHPRETENPTHHYDAGGIATIDVLRAKLTAEQYRGYLLGRVIDLSLRLNHKGSNVADAEKLAVYANWLVETYDD